MPVVTDDHRKAVMRDYWGSEIGHWARTSYERSHVSGLVSKFMAHLRSSVEARAITAGKILAPHVKGKTLLDLGCGHGGFALSMLEAGATRVIGWDIAPQAIELANEQVKKLGVGDRAEFKVALVEDANFPETDFVTGLGLLDWMPPHEIKTMLGRLSGRKAMFSYSELDGSFDEIVHRIWLCKRLEWFGGGVRAYHHPRELILRWFRDAGFGRMTIVAKPEARFGRLIHNLDA
jgi:SAM-dependent methyltransferase